MIQLTFSQSTGQLRVAGALIGLAYSGNGDGVNNPAMQSVHDIGPIPAGSYIGKKIVCPEEGPSVWELTPSSTTVMFGRGGFRLHWDNRSHNFTASKGCIVPVMPSTFIALPDTFELTVLA